MVGELFDLDQIVRFGDPWHGVWHGTSNQITTIPGPVVACPGVAPAAGFPPRRHGECFLFDVGGLPTPTPDSSDATAGRTWLNYGLIAGADHRLYGVALGSKAWIYLAPDGSRWLAKFTTLSANLDNATAEIELTLTEFGIFGKSGAPVAQTVNLGTFSLNLNAATPNDFFAYSASHAATIGIEDIWSDGSKVLISVGIGCVAVDQPRVDARVLFTVLECGISGVPPAANVSLTTVLTQAQVGPAPSSSVTKQFVHVLAVHELSPLVYTVYSTTDGSPTHDWTSVLAGSPPYSDFTTGDAVVSISETYAQEVVVGVRYAPGGSVSVLRRVETHAMSYSATISFSGGSTFSWAASDVDIINGKVALTLDGTELHAIPLQVDLRVTGGDASATYTLSQTIGSQSANESGSTANGFPLRIQRAQFFSPGQAGAIMSIFYKEAAALNTLLIWPLRYTNAVYGMFGEAISSGASTFRLFPVFGKFNSNSNELAITSGALPMYCTEHPVSGVLLRDSEPVAFV